MGIFKTILLSTSVGICATCTDCVFSKEGTIHCKYISKFHIKRKGNIPDMHSFEIILFRRF